MYEISIQQLVYFFTAAEYLNFSRASESLYMAQPAFSKWIAKMETTLGVKLFDRVYHGVALTEAGSYLYDTCRPLVDELCRSLNYAQSTWGMKQKRVAVGCLNSFQRFPVVLQNVYRYKSSYPTCTLAMEILEIDHLRKALCDRELDICIAPEFIFKGLSNIKTKTIHYLPTYISIAQNHPLADKPDLSVADLRNETFCLMPPTEHGGLANERTYDLCRRYGFQPQKVQYTKNLSAREAAILLGSVSIGSGASNSPEIRQIPIEGKHIYHEAMTLAWLDDSGKPEVRAFVELFEDLDGIK